MNFPQEMNGSDGENRKDAPGPREYAGIRGHGEAERGASATSERLADSPIPHMKARPLYVDLIILALICGLLMIILRGIKGNIPVATATTTVQSAGAASSGSIASATMHSATTSAAATSSAKAPKGLNKATNQPVRSPEASRIPDPYPTPPLSWADVNASTRAALVNIFCYSASGSFGPVSGTGVIIDPRGVILTNAHVAQYVLLSEIEKIHLSCRIRTGSPARGSWIPAIMYLPPVWVNEHASELRVEHPLGTGEHDYALLYIGLSADGTATPSSFPSIVPDTREGIGFAGDQVIAAGYPAEFVGGSVSTSLNAASSITSIAQLLTFSTSSIDAISVGGVIEAQSGSSGGAIVNAWDRLIGIITTTSEAPQTSARDLRAVTLSYIDRDLRIQTGQSLSELLSDDPAAHVIAFRNVLATPLAKKLYDQLTIHH